MNPNAHHLESGKHNVSVKLAQDKLTSLRGGARWHVWSHVILCILTVMVGGETACLGNDAE